jgi:hypothetical protein
MTNHNVQQADLQGEPSITREHVQNNTSVRNIFEEGELVEQAVCANFARTRLPRVQNPDCIRRIQRPGNQDDLYQVRAAAQKADYLADLKTGSKLA